MLSNINGRFSYSHGIPKENSDVGFTAVWEEPNRLRLSQGASLKPDESGGCYPVSEGRTIRRCSSWPSDDPPTRVDPR